MGGGQGVRRVMTGVLLAGTVAAFAAFPRGAMVHGQQGTGQTPSPFPLSNAIRERGSSVTGAFEGWFYNKDGSVGLLVGYFNRNTKQEFDIPLGPNNRIEPGGPDMGQPTHFMTGRQWGVFVIRVPKDFGTKKLTWTIVSNGQTNAITLHTKPEYIVEPFEDPANKNTPPVLKFAEDGPGFTGPPQTIAATYTATVGMPLTLTMWASDEGPKINVPESGRGRGRGRGGDAAAAAAAAAGFTPPPPLAVVWSLLRGPGAVKFDRARPSIDKDANGKTTATATFSEPGEYILRAQANDSTGEGGGGFQCCWTNAHVKVTVKAPVPSGD
ncbi:MAG TPA: hypothetical protein VMS04_10300 [Vicinamibacterales bacterium]|nr:hypothetical protein [Vicinamibacterales bacterium]